MRQQLKLFLTPSLAGRIDYMATSYRNLDSYGHAEIHVDGVPVVNFCCYKPEYLCRCSFVEAAGVYLNSPLKVSLEGSGEEIRKALAILDRRVGKRTLRSLTAAMADESALVRFFCALRCRAEGIPVNFEVPETPITGRK